MPKFNKKYIPALIEAKKNFPLSGICSKLHRLAFTDSSAYNDIADFHAPIECYRLVQRNLQKKADQAIAESGFLCREVLAGVLRKRTSDRWFYFSSIAQFLESDDE